MKLGIIIPMFFFLGCGSSPDPTTDRDPSHHEDAGVAVDANSLHNPESGLCCQLTYNDTDSSIWNNFRFTCHGGDGVNDVPWLCFNNDDKAMACTDVHCVVGDACQGVNGTGVVIPCDWSSDAGYEGGIATVCAGPEDGCGNLWCWPDCQNGYNTPPSPPGVPHPTPHTQM